MALLEVGQEFPYAILLDIDGKTIEFPGALKRSPASVVFFYRGQW